MDLLMSPDGTASPPEGTTVGMVTVVRFFRSPGPLGRAQSLSKMLRSIPGEPIGFKLDWLSSCNSPLTLRALKIERYS
jgi:hypothetical protein